MAAYNQGMADDSVLDEIQDNAREAGQRLRASLNLLRSQGMFDNHNYRELETRLTVALAMVAGVYSEAMEATRYVGCTSTTPVGYFAVRQGED